VHTAGMAFAQMTDAVPFYAGLTLDAIGGRGVRWGETDVASAFPRPQRSLEPPAPHPVHGDGALRLGTFRSIWAGPEVEASPSLQFLAPKQRVEVSPEDARRLGLGDGDRVRVGTNGTRVNAKVVVRAAIPPGTVFLEDALGADSANALTGPTVEVEKA
jgi:NADH-quinone oxidoreductase subunit G